MQWYAGLIAFLVSWALIPLLRRVALKWGFVDLPNQRKIHHEPLPLLGGVAIFAGFLAATLTSYHSFSSAHKMYLGLLIGAVLLFSIGLIDDFAKTRGRDFPAMPRFITQIVAASCVAGFGGTVKGFTSPFGHSHFVVLPPPISILVTIIWIVGVVNVFNFLDGLDGLAAGIAAISAVTLLFIALVKADLPSAIWAISLAGASLGFLKHNFYPARIIMGDAGSTVIGFLLASIAVIGAFKSATVISIFVPILALGVPIFDAIRVVLRRALSGKPVYKPDKSHVHHRLLDAGLSQVQTVAVMYLVSVCFSLVSMIVALSQR